MADHDRSRLIESLSFIKDSIGNKRQVRLDRLDRLG